MQLVEEFLSIMIEKVNYDLNGQDTNTQRGHYNAMFIKLN